MYNRVNFYKVMPLTINDVTFGDAVRNSGVLDPHSQRVLSLLFGNVLESIRIKLQEDLGFRAFFLEYWQGDITPGKVRNTIAVADVQSETSGLLEKTLALNCQPFHKYTYRRNGPQYRDEIIAEINRSAGNPRKYWSLLEEASRAMSFPEHILQKHIHTMGRRFKLLSIGMEMSQVNFSEDGGFMLPGNNAQGLVFDPKYQDFFRNMSSWNIRQIHDRVHIVESEGEKFILKETKTPFHWRHNKDGDLLGSLTPSQECAVGIKLLENTTLRKDEVQIKWEKPIGYVESQDGNDGFAVFEDMGDLMTRREASRNLEGILPSDEIAYRFCLAHLLFQQTVQGSGYKIQDEGDDEKDGVSLGLGGSKYQVFLSQSGDPIIYMAGFDYEAFQNVKEIPFSKNQAHEIVERWGRIYKLRLNNQEKKSFDGKIEQAIQENFRD